jgi:hypothetical protein
VSLVANDWTDEQPRTVHWKKNSEQYHKDGKLESDRIANSWHSLRANQKKTMKWRAHYAQTERGGYHIRTCKVTVHLIKYKILLSCVWVRLRTLDLCCSLELEKHKHRTRTKIQRTSIPSSVLS